MTSVQYLLKLKNNLENQILFFQEQESFLKEMIGFHFDTEEEYDKIDNFLNEYNLEDFFLDINVEKDRETCCEFLKDRLSELHSIKEKIEKQIYKLCNHTFIKDYVDYFPDISVPIQYCSNCYSNFDYDLEKYKSKKEYNQNINENINIPM